MAEYNALLIGHQLAHEMGVRYLEAYDNTQGKHTHHAHARKHTHTHKHAHMYGSGRIYVCTHYGRKGHLEKFCFAKNNVNNKHVWVRPGTNPIGPKKVWVPKDPPNLNDTGGF